jgi:hypothetical protein
MFSAHGHDCLIQGGIYLSNNMATARTKDGLEGRVMHGRHHVLVAVNYLSHNSAT